MVLSAMCLQVWLDMVWVFAMSLLTPPALPDLSRITAIYESSAASTEYGAPVRYGYYAIEARARLLDQGIGGAGPLARDAEERLA